MAMSDSEDRTPQASASSDSTSGARRQMRLTTSQNIGYCHVCDKQVEIDEDHFSCSECHGGFVELFELDAGGGGGSASGGAASAAQVLTSQAGETNFLPFLLSQMLNQQVAGASASGHPRAQMSFQRSQQPNVMTPLNRTMSEGSAAAGTGSAATRHGGQQTRVQLIVPGEQFDLYGIINTVLQDILDPSRQQNTQIHFHQAPPM